MIIFGIELKYDDNKKHIQITDEEAEDLRIVLQKWKLEKIVFPLIAEHDYKFDTSKYSKEALLDTFQYDFLDSLSDIIDIDGFEDEIDERLNRFVEDNADEYGIIKEGE